MERKKHTNKRIHIKNHWIIEKRIIIRKDMEIILAYSVKRIKEKYKEEYSVIEPATNSDSASGKSKGTLFDSPKRERKKNNKETGLLPNAIKSIIRKRKNNNTEIKSRSNIKKRIQ